MDFFTQAKQEASQWARGVLKDTGAVILDSETTALEGEIIELSIITVTGETLLDTLIRPEGEISASAEAVHGITANTVANAPTFPEVFPELKQILESASRVIIYNVGFDLGRLRSDAARHELLLPSFRSECAMRQYAKWYGEWNRRRGSFRWQRLDGGHRALGDCRATLQALRRMAEEDDEG